MSTTRSRIALVIGTRPEAIKMAPVYAALRDHPRLAPLVLATTQHREMLRQALGAFAIVPDIDLELMQDGQQLGTFTARAMSALTETFLRERPAYALVQGDTSTVAAAALAAFYQGIPVGHVEAGLRSYDLTSPFPEEANRRVASVVATAHFAPTADARDNLLAEGIPSEDIDVTGNTVVDALRMIPARPHFETPALNAVPWEGRRILLATVHRRESHGAQLEAICAGFATLVTQFPDTELVLPVHLNPRVREVVHRMLGNIPRVHLMEPIPYPDLLEAIRRCTLILSDSGGIQEEAPSFRKPIQILRDTTERPEVVRAGFGELVGTDTDVIVSSSSMLLSDPSAYTRRISGANPFGDGHAAERIVAVLDRQLATPRPGLGARRQTFPEVLASLAPRS
jgi:UDP-N-acetylglucosamine 2-epimerase (non-hydrolysing)